MRYATNIIRLRKPSMLQLLTIRTGATKLLSGLLILTLAILAVFLSAQPVASAQTNSINYTNTNLTNRDFSHQNLERGVFVSAELRNANL
jgi:uncharacterized protein YjbI with pentapeptide repeats